MEVVFLLFGRSWFGLGFWKVGLSFGRRCFRAKLWRVKGGGSFSFVWSILVWFGVRARVRMERWFEVEVRSPSHPKPSILNPNL